MTLPRVRLRPDFDVPQIIKGNWQIADDHSPSVGDADAIYEHMLAYFDAGITGYDCGDIYYGVEEKIGQFIQRLRAERGAAEAARVAVHTKYIPAFLQEDELRAHGRGDVIKTIDRSLSRLKIDRLHLVQLHWWNYEIEGGTEAALVLQELQQAGKIQHIGCTNYNVAEMRKIVDAGVDVVSNQVQFSLLDRRPVNGMVEYCRQNDIGIMAYGTIAGGLFSKKWLGVEDPGKPAFENVSLDKYYRIIRDFGGWELFQELLSALSRIAERHGVSIAAVASRYVVEEDGVVAVILGSRHARHLQDNLSVAAFDLDDDDRAEIAPILARATGPLGDCYDLDRAENRDADENVATEFVDAENGKLVVRNRPELTVAEAYGHHIKP